MGMISIDTALSALSSLYMALERMTTRLQPWDRESGWVDDYAILHEYIEGTRSHDEDTGIEHPSHYQTEGGLECIDVMNEVFGADEVRVFARLNAFKYLWRAGKKEGQSQEKDLKKAAYYLSLIHGKNS